ILSSNVSFLQELIVLQEIAGQERALTASLSDSCNLSLENIHTLHFLRESQKQHYFIIVNIFKSSKLSSEIKSMHEKYMNNYYNKVRENIQNYEIQENHLLELLKSKFKQITKGSDNKLKVEQIRQLYSTYENIKIEIDPKKWFEISSARIDEIHNLENKVFTNIQRQVWQKQEELDSGLAYHVLLASITILIMLFGSLFVANIISNSIKELDNGIKDFFDYLNFKRDLPNKINIHSNSNDEINNMAQNVNSQMALTQNNLDEDKLFIGEATQIVKHMEENGFSEKSYRNPYNPDLIKLKNVLDELVLYISEKIKEQIIELEELNLSLEDKVYKQTLTLQNQIEDITEARDKAVQAEKSKDDFLAAMSHEIRTPLNAILGFVGILQKNIKDEENKNHLNIIDNSGQSLLTVINDILDFSKIQSGQFKINLHEASTIEEFSNAVLLFASKAYEKHLIYPVYIDTKLPKTINVDMVRIRQILSNILSNAMKFTREDGVVYVKIFYEDNNLIISVEDSGIGISKANQFKVFSAFEQADGTTTRKYGGTGLGLAISSKLATLMNGTLTLQSQEGKGSTFTLTLPIEIIDNEPTELIDTEKLSHLKIALLNTCRSGKVSIELIKKYLIDFGIENVFELSEYQKDGYDILFFVPDAIYNMEIVESKTPAIAMLRTNTMKLADLDHVQALYAPFVPKTIIQAINDTGVENIRAIEVVDVIDEDEIQFDGSVLIVEDNKTNQMFISILLDDHGLDYDIANDGVEAVSMFKEGNYDIVLMDENMPNLNGIGAMQQIKAYEKENALLATPIIAVTASALDSDKERFLDAGMDGFVAKPINPSELEIEFKKYLKVKEV
ncbi:MAG: response regulator, partial [Sulfurimonas sp.]|nr:response regulator [Sulfurimonas sp.]